MTIENGLDPVLLAITGAFACGKSRLTKELRTRFGFEKPTTVTTRPPRADEIDGVDYHFRTPAQFAQMLRDGLFLETALINGRSYGTLKTSIEEPLNEGRSIAVCVDIQGVIALKNHPTSDLVRNSLLSVWLDVGYKEAVERARSRPGGMGFEELRTRTKTRWREESLKHECQHRIPNPDGAFETTVARVHQIYMRRRIEVDCCR
jgi:guanylate kinase